MQIAGGSWMGLSNFKLQITGAPWLGLSSHLVGDRDLPRPWLLPVPQSQPWSEFGFLDLFCGRNIFTGTTYFYCSLTFPQNMFLNSINCSHQRWLFSGVSTRWSKSAPSFLDNKSFIVNFLFMPCSIVLNEDVCYNHIVQVHHSSQHFNLTTAFRWRVFTE